MSEAATCRARAWPCPRTMCLIVRKTAPLPSGKVRKVRKVELAVLFETGTR